MLMRTALLAITLVLISCKHKVTGTFEAEKDIIYKKGNRAKVLPQGHYLGTLRVGKDNAILDLDGVSTSAKVKFDIPGRELLPQNGTVFLRSAQIGQPFDLEAQVDTETLLSEPIHSIESCSYTRYVQICPGHGDWYHGRYGHRSYRWDDYVYWRDYHYAPYPGCYYDYLTFHGERAVIYRNRTVNRTVEVTLNQEGADLGSFAGGSVASDRVYESRGECR